MNEAAVNLREMMAAEKWSEVIQALADANPASAPLDVSIAAYRSHTKCGQPMLAEAWLDRALELSPANATLQRDKGVLHQKRQEWSEAAARFAEAARLRPEVATYHASLGYARAQDGDHAGSAQALRQAVGIDKSNRAWWLRLARVLVHLNELQEAVRAYNKALALQEDLTARSARDELLRQIRSGSRAASAAYYDAVFAESPKYGQPGQTSEYVPVWRHVLAGFRSAGTRRVLDLGCGPGQFAEFVAAEMPGLEYVGVDFSGVAISRARQRCPSYLFEKRELPLADFAGLPAFDTVVCMEVLEHVEHDCEILAALPKGMRVIASVPNFDSFGHIRVFSNEAEIRDRYGSLLEDLRIQPVALTGQNTLWLLQGTRSAARDTANGVTGVTGVTGVAGAVKCEASAMLPSEGAVESVLWSDQTRYVQDFLGMFGLPFVTLDDSRRLTEPHVALRHDVDWSIEHACAMATLEHQLGIRSTYYLLHPDGLITSRNYFGQVEDGRLLIDPQLFEWAARLLDLGHEVGLHNDLITLSLATRRQPGEFLEQIIEEFLRRGIPLTGTAAHGSRICRERGYMNYQIFRELQTAQVAVDYQDSPDLFERFSEPEIERDGHVVPKFQLAMADYGLTYEANFVPWEIYLSDSSARWSLWQGEHLTRFDKFTPKVQMVEALQGLLKAKSPWGAVQCLVHACHWSVVEHHVSSALPAVRKLRNVAFATSRREAMLRRLAAFPNVLMARATDRFDAYDQEYGTKRQLYNVTSTVTRFVERLAGSLSETARRLLEVGCGQGDFLAMVHQIITAGGRSDVRSLGVDGSPAAIVSCAGRYRDIFWAADELEHFLEVHDSVHTEDDGKPVRYDIVLDKTGAVFITDYHVACRYFEVISRLMRPGSVYVYVASRHYYEENLRKKTYVDWPEHWMQIAERTFQLVETDDDEAPALRGYYKRVYSKRDDPEVTG
jgi:2-polyprenyl-3-methyl-5-hydroxy-6-metoxy-1,4-benzoquinol methylase